MGGRHKESPNCSSWVANRSIVVNYLILFAALFSQTAAHSKLTSLGNPPPWDKPAAETTPVYPEGDGVYIIMPTEGQVVTSPVTVRFGLKGMGIAPAGVDKANSGHHHLLIDIVELPGMTLPIPADENHVHFGGGQTETTIELAPGQHTLQLLLGNYLHIPHESPVVSKRITITVQ